MDCIIAAGGNPQPDDPLFVYTKGAPKALIDMNGRTMLERVVDALQMANHVDRIVIIGLGSDMDQTFQRPVDQHLPNQGSMVANIMAGINWLRQVDATPRPVLFCSADIPTITGGIVDAHVESCMPLDRAIYYTFVTRQILEQRFPHSNRTYVKLKGTEIAGGDLAIAQMDLADSNPELWEALTNARKHAWKLARIVGIGTLLRYLFRQLSMGEIEAKAASILGQPVQVVLSPFAELAMDADKPAQVELLREDLRQRGV